MQREFGPIANTKSIALAAKAARAELKASVLAREYVERNTHGRSKALKPKATTALSDAAPDYFATTTQWSFPAKAMVRLAALVHGNRHGWRPPLRNCALQRTCFEFRRRGGRHRLYPNQHAQWPERAGARAVDTNIELASVKAVLSALNRS